MKEHELGAYDARAGRVIEWSQHLEVGVEAIDAGHRTLIDLYNAVRHAGQMKDRAWIGVLLERLGNATASHFDDEERLMSDIDYPHAAAHREEHQKLLDEFAHQVEEWRGHHNSVELLCRFLYGWLLSHISAMDRQLGRAIAPPSSLAGEP